MDQKKNFDPTLLLNSAHGRFPVGGDSWVRVLLTALDKLNPGNHQIITSVGMASWELAAWVAGARGYSQRIILPGEDNGAGRRYFERCLDELDLDRARTTPVFSGQHDSKKFRTARDRLAFEIAEVVYPLSVRPGGRLDTLLSAYTAAGGKTDDCFRTAYRSGGWKPGYKLDAGSLNPAVREFDSGWLFHWTHSHPGPWPTENPACYYRDLTEKPSHYVRSAASTRARIAGEGTVRGSSFHKSGGAMMVSLTALPPSEALPLMRWRSRWRRWSLEPYGIAIRREALVRLGARRVRYFDEIPSTLNAEEKKFSQRRGEITDWSGEREWRISGDIRLDNLPGSEIALLAYDSNWPEQYPDPAGQYRVVPLFG